MHTTTKALVLRTVDYKESDQVLTLMTREMGKMTVTARGVRKKNSSLAAGCQLLCWSEMVLFDYQGRWSVKEAATEREFLGLRRDLGKLALGCYFAEVAQELAVEGEAFPELLSLTLNSLHALDQMDKPLSMVKGAFEWKAMCLAGYEPMLEGCSVCGTERPDRPRFYPREGVLSCTGCRQEGGRQLNEEALAAMRHVAYGNPKRLFSFPTEGKGMQEFSAAAEEYLLVQMERGFRTLDFYKSVSL